jgi:hypothetical protein
MFVYRTPAALALAILGLALAAGPAPAAAGAGGSAGGGAGSGASIPVDRSSPTPAPAAVTDPVGKRALHLATALQAGNLDRTELSTSLNAELGDETLVLYKKALNGLGTPTRALFRGRYREDSDTRFVYNILFPGGVATLTFAIDDGTEKISVLYLRGS